MKFEINKRIQIGNLSNGNKTVKMRFVTNKKVQAQILKQNGRVLKPGAKIGNEKLKMKDKMWRRLSRNGVQAERGK